MKILLCHNFYQQAGGEDRVFADEGRLLESQGHEVLRYTKHNDEIKSLSKLSLTRKTIWNRQTFSELESLLAKERPDVMHCTNIFPLISPAAYSAARKHGVAVVQSLHNYRLLCPNALFLRNDQACEDCLGKWLPWPGVLHACYRDSRAATGMVAAMLGWHRLRGTWNRAVDRYIAVTQFSRGKFVAGGLPAERIAVKPNFVDSQERPGPPQKNFALYVGRLSREKGILPLLAAWKTLRGNIPLHIVGDGPLAAEVQQAVAAGDGITWHGQQPASFVKSVMRQAAFLILPSICYENCPMTLLEAYACGTPVVASRLGAMVELIHDQSTGLLFEAGNPQALASAVSHLWQANAQRELMRVKARAMYEDCFSPGANYQCLMEIYAEAMAQVPNRSRAVSLNASHPVPAEQTTPFVP